jgi:hypothetical protein
MTMLYHLTYFLSLHDVTACPAFVLLYSVISNSSLQPCSDRSHSFRAENSMALTKAHRTEQEAVLQQLEIPLLCCERNAMLEHTATTVQHYLSI